jgi:hypothetical protein
MGPLWIYEVKNGPKIRRQASTQSAVRIGRIVHSAFLYASDLLELDGEDVRLSTLEDGNRGLQAARRLGTVTRDTERAV